MNEQPFFSVGVPTYNRVELLKSALNHLLAQSYTHFEIIIGDNCSTDGTEAFVRSLQDPRIRYFRHPENIGPMPNFVFLTKQARGEFVLIHQDDDLLHHEFLKRCYETVSLDPEIVFYATPWWRGNALHGFRSKLFRDVLNGKPDYVMRDQPLIMDGKIGAVSLLHSFHFAHPAIAFRRSALEASGGYCPEVENVSDVITEARVLCRGKFAYDPRIGGIFTDHGQNASRTMSKQFKLLTYLNMYAGLLKEIEACGVDWPSLLSKDLELYSDNELLAVFSEWARYHAPRRLQAHGWKTIRNRRSMSGLKLVRKLLAKVGWRNLLRFGQVMMSSR